MESAEYAPPHASDSLAAFTMASVSSVVMSTILALSSITPIRAESLRIPPRWAAGAGLPQPGSYRSGEAAMRAPASWSRNLLPPHLLPPSAEGPPESVGTVLRAVAAGRTSARIAPALRAFASKRARELEPELKEPDAVESLGCDAVGDKGISRLGSRIERVCYASYGSRLAARCDRLAHHGLTGRRWTRTPLTADVLTGVPEMTRALLKPSSCHRDRSEGAV